MSTNGTFILAASGAPINITNGDEYGVGALSTNKGSTFVAVPLNSGVFRAPYGTWRSCAMSKGK